MTETSSERPRPIVDADSAEYWRLLREHRFSAPRCVACGHVFLYPRALCPRCFSDAQRYVRLSGRATVYSFTVSRRASVPAFEPFLPLVVALVELEEGPRIMTNLLGADPADVRIGDIVVLDYLDLDDEITLPVFRIPRSSLRPKESR